MALLRPAMVPLVAAMMLAGCVTDSLIPERFRSQQTAEMSQAPPRVRPNNHSEQTSDEIVADATDKATGALQSSLGGETETMRTASLQPVVSVGRAELLGVWKVTSGNDNCELFMSLTSWSGGYRAITKGCSAPDLAAVQAWSLHGQEIALLGRSGDAVVRLTATEKTRLNGKTDDGQSILVFR